MNKTLITIATLLVLVFSQNVLAGHKKHSRQHDKYVDYARVVHVKPIYKTVRVAVPVEQCRHESIQRPVKRRVKYAAPEDVLLGGIVGGIIGHELGDRHNKEFTTIAGAIIGSTIASSANAKYYRTADYRTQHRERCRIETQYRSEQQLVGYRVRYRYKGEMYTTRMNEHPGKRIPVKVKVIPVDRLY